MPLRPQAIFILGTNFVTRTIINTIISIASLFTSEKVLDRVRFAYLDEVKTKIPDSSMPKHVGGGSLLDTTDKVFDWMRERLRNFTPCLTYFPRGPDSPRGFRRASVCP